MKEDFLMREKKQLFFWKISSLEKCRTLPKRPKGVTLGSSITSIFVQLSLLVFQVQSLFTDDKMLKLFYVVQYSLFAAKIAKQNVLFVDFVAVMAMLDSVVSFEKNVSIKLNCTQSAFNMVQIKLLLRVVDRY